MPTLSERDAIEAILMMKPSLYQRRCGFLAKAREVRLSGLAKKKAVKQKRADAARWASTVKNMSPALRSFFK